MAAVRTIAGVLLLAVQNPVDAALTEEADALDPSKEIPELLARASRLLRSDLRLARQQAERALRLAVGQGDRLAEADAAYMVARACEQAGQWDPALDHVRLVAELCRNLGDESRLARAHALLGRIYRELGEHELALNALLRALAAQEQAGEAPARAETERFLAQLYQSVRDTARATSYAERSVTDSEAAGSDEARVLARATLGAILRDAGDLDRAEGVLTEALEIARQGEDPRGEAIALQNLGLLLNSRDRPDEARDAFLASLEVFRSVGHKNGEVACMHSLGELAVVMGDSEDAGRWLDLALSESRALGFKVFERDCLDALTNLHERAGDFERSFKTLKALRAVETALFDETADRRLKAAQAAHQVAQAEREAELHRARTAELEQRNAEMVRLHDQLQEAYARQATLMTQLERQTLEDGLTGLWNRRYLDRRLPEELTRGRRANRPLSVAVADIDNFKQINDQLSHIVGDEVLKRVADAMRKHCRATDVVVRYGGEEFVVIFPDTPIASAAGVADKLRLAVMDTNWRDLHPALIVTMSVGVAGAQPADTPDQVLARGDARLLAAKAAGKNRVLV